MSLGSVGQGGGGGRLGEGGTEVLLSPSDMCYIYDECHIDIHMHVLMNELLSFSVIQFMTMHE